MIVPSMSYKEMYDNLAKDKEKVDYRKNYYLPRAIKELKRMREFPACKWYDYTIPSTGNQYVLFYYAENPSCLNNPLCDSFFVYFVNKKRFAILWGAGMYKHRHEQKLMAIRDIRAFTSHFFQRYNERFLKNDTLSSNDVACRFFARNLDFMPISINEEINNNIAAYDDLAKQGFRIKDGFCFARTGVEENQDDAIGNANAEAIITVFTTYMPESEMSEVQRNAIDKEHWKNWIQSVKDFEKEAINGSVTLTLQ